MIEAVWYREVWAERYLFQSRLCYLRCELSQVICNNGLSFFICNHEDVEQMVSVFLKFLSISPVEDCLLFCKYMFGCSVRLGHNF